jgi:hypothetical protein
VAAAGSVIVFMCLFAGTVILSAYVLAFTAHCFLVVVNDTAAGIDEVKWPNEPVADWIGGAAYMGALVALWLVPAGILTRALREDLLPDDKPLRLLVLAGPGLWLYVPIGLLSSMSATSRWTLFRWTIVWQMMRIFPRVFLFYLVTALLGAVIGVSWYIALFRGQTYLLLLAGMLTAAGVLIYARLVGRLAWLVSRLKPRKTPVKPRAASTPPPPNKGRKNRAPGATRGRATRRVEATDPWAIPDADTLRETERAAALPEEGYAFASDDPKPTPEAKPKKKKKVVEPTHPLEMERYEMDAASPPPRPVETPLDGNDPIGTEELRPEEQTGNADSNLDIQRTPPPKPQPIPTYPFISGVYTFPWYATSMKAWLWLTIGATAVGGCVVGLIAMSPF